MLVFFVVLMVFAAGCVFPPNPLIPEVTTTTQASVINGVTSSTLASTLVNASSEDMAAVVDGNNQFAFDIYHDFIQDSANEGKNLFFSPYSISTALAMTYEGARGDTAAEMANVLHLPQDDSVRRNGYSAVTAWINKGDKKYQLSTANALWVQEDYNFLPEYFDVVGRYYGGGVTNMDFKNDAENSRNIINVWVEDRTNSKIKNLIPAGVINELTRLVLTNAIYFKGDWVTQFDKKNTREMDFRISPTETVKAQMMYLKGKDVKFPYAETEDMQVLEMPYSGDELSMLILLPKNDDLTGVESSLTAGKLQEIRSGLTEREVTVYLPKFKLETKSYLAVSLMRMGMPTPFSTEADFSGMDGTRNLSITAVIHQAFVDVNEEGTEAAAATAVVVGLAMAERPLVFQADHPFIFIIQEKKTGNILFVGRLEDPTATQ